MKFPWRSRRPAVRFESTRVVESRVAPGVKYTIVAMTFARRVELMTRVREIARKLEFLKAGEDPEQKMDAGLLRAEVEERNRLHLRAPSPATQLPGRRHRSPQIRRY